MDRHEDALPLLKASQSTMQHSMGKNYPAAGEARFYIALSHASNPLLEAEKHEIYSELEQVCMSALSCNKATICHAAPQPNAHYAEAMPIQM